MGAVRVGIALKIRVVVRRCNRWKMMLVVLSIGLLCYKMILKYQSGEKHELTNDMMKRAKGEGIVRYSKSKNQMILRAKYEHISSLTINWFCGLEVSHRPESSSGACEAASDTRTCQKISPRRWPVFWPWLRVRLAVVAVLQSITKSKHGIAPLSVDEGWETAYASSRVFNP